MSEERQSRIAIQFNAAIAGAIDEFLINHIPNANVSNNVLKALTGAAPTLAERLPSPDPVELIWVGLLRETLIAMLPAAAPCPDTCLWASGD